VAAFEARSTNCRICAVGAATRVKRDAMGAHLRSVASERGRGWFVGEVEGRVSASLGVVLVTR
jgi:hypothetical protein